MRYDFQDLDNLGRNIQELVDRAVNSRDYRQLNQTIRQTVGSAVRKAADHANRPVEPPVRPPVSQPAPKRDLPALYANTGGQTTMASFKIAGGGILACVSLMTLAGTAMLNWIGFFVGYFPVLPALGMMGLGGWLLTSGIWSAARLKRFKTYRRTLGQSTSCPLEKLARSVGKSVKFVHNEVSRMIGEGLFLEGHLDREERTLITSHETFRQFEQSRLQLEARQREAAAMQQAAVSRDPRVQEVLDRGGAFVGQIRKCNDDIPGEEISAKIDRMEDIVRRIFCRAEAHPEVVPDLKKLMDYYLPMTVKLLNAYADMDAQPIQGGNILASKREIEATLDTLNLAFEKLLDDLFMDTVMDVSSDISVLNTLLAQEGLTEDDLTKMKKQQKI